MQDQTAPIIEAFGAFFQAQFALTDMFRRAQGDALGAFGYNPSECPYDVTASTAYWRLRDYGGPGDAPSLLIVAAPIKRPYVWDISPSASAVRYCLEHGFHVYLLEWKPACSATGNNGIDEHARAVLECVNKISGRANGARPFLIGHSLGGTLAAMSCALTPESVQGLALISAPLCFEPGRSEFRDALVSLIPSVLPNAESFPGSLLSYVSAMASPRSFVWSRLRDAAMSADDSNAREMHRRVERWALDEVAVPGKLFQQITGWLYRENRLCRGILSIGGTLVVPASLSIPTLAIVNTADDVAPLTSIKSFIDAMPKKKATVIEYPGEAGVCLQHLAILIGREARNRIWPEIVSWLHSHC
jgi:polyhydroxyalkanoate synthase